MTGPYTRTFARFLFALSPASLSPPDPSVSDLPRLIISGLYAAVFRSLAQPQPDMKGFVVLRRRTMVGRTFSWFGRNQCLIRDFEDLAETLATFVTLASIQLALRRLARA